MRLFYCFTSISMLVWLLNCTANGGKEALTAPETLYAAFEAHSSTWDTLRFFLADQPSDRPVSDTLLKKCLDKATFEYLHFQTGAPKFWAGKKYPFADDLDVCLLNIEEFWFKKQVLLFYDKTKHTFVSAREVAHFYGGDGGQTAMESWLFHKPPNPCLYFKIADHWLVIEQDQDEPTEHLLESGELLCWERSAFVPVMSPDSLRLKKHFKMHHQW